MKARKPDKRIPLLDVNLSREAKQLVARTLASGWLTSGPRVREFEQAVAAYMNVKHAAAVNSCSMGLQLALRSVGAGPGKEIVTTPFTFVATIEAILATGARPVFADIEPHTLIMDTDEAARQLSRKSLAVLPVDIAGHPSHYGALKEICHSRSLHLIADASHSFGALYGGKSIPRLCDAAVYSFHSTKNLTCGEGGMVVSRRRDIIEDVRRLALHGITKPAHERRAKKTWAYDVTDYGFKANMSDVHAAIGLGQMAVFDSDQASRRKLVERYLESLGDLADYIELPRTAEKTQPAWHLFIIKLHLSRLKISRDGFIREMSRRRVECGVHYKPVFELAHYRRTLGLDSRQFPNTVSAGRRVVTLPLYAGLTAAQVDYICESVRDILTRFGRQS
ncbi:MAG: DegT/DnrJ/EryC1/StrS family aminotransferase [candidate division Zixibacteria bacterium]|nr:DegT/DnrJ/EryC1/StrS family aminotransferase [candidate division Zixibacteria bacterium]